MGFYEIISNEAVTHFLSTFGLAVLLVLYFVLWRDPRQAKYWRERYDKLIENYNSLSKNYNHLEENLRPESRMCSPDQARNLAELGLDRDLYKLYYYMCEKVDGRRPESIATFIAESIRHTNDVWLKFKSPFLRVPHIGDLYGIYTNNGESLKQELEKIFEEKSPNEEKKLKLLNLLFENTVNMKNEFQKFIQNLSKGIEISPYHEQAEAAKS
jgi:hypothetical protein